MLVAGANPVFTIHVFEIPGTEKVNNGSVMADTKVGGRELIGFYGIDHVINAAAFLLADSQCASSIAISASIRMLDTALQLLQFSPKHPQGANYRASW